MTPGVSGRHSSWPLLLLSVGYLWFSLPGGALFLLGPVGLLLLVSRPTTGREWATIALIVGALALTFRGHPTLMEQTGRAAGIFFAGAFAALTLTGRGTAVGRALGALLAAAAASTAWFARLGISYADLKAGVIAQLWSTWRQALPDLPAAPVPISTIIDAAGKLNDMSTQLSIVATGFGELFPALMGLVALVGSWLAWRWYHRLSPHPMGPRPGPFAAFRFNDHLIWGLIVTGALALFQLPAPLTMIQENLLGLFVGLYSIRGLAIFLALLATVSPRARLLLGVGTVLLLFSSIAFVGWLLLGVADTWLDLRRRFPPPEGAFS